jgi:DedD protein
MELRARERLIGALVLVGAVVLLVPAILQGRAPEPEDDAAQSASRYLVQVEPEEPAPRDDEPVPEPQLPREPTGSVEPPEKGGTALSEERVMNPVRSSPPAPVPATREADPPAAGSPAWAVQLGAFSHRDKADSLVANLRRRGYAAFVLEYRGAGRVLYRVRVGPEQDRERVQEIAARLGKDGYQPVVARHP